MNYFILFFLVLDIIFINCINPLLCVTFLIYLTLGIILNIILFQKIDKKYLCSYLVLVFFAIVIYLIQLRNIPEYFGFSGARGYGTDDSYFYSRAITYYPGLKNLPFNFPLRYGIEFKNYIEKNGFSYYAWILSRFCYIVNLYKRIEPLDLILVNALVQSFLPIFTYKLSDLLFNNKEISKTSFWLTLFSPLLIANGLVLVRDVWAATFFIATLYYFIECRYYFIITLFLLFFIRKASAGQAVFSLIIVWFFRKKDKGKYILLLLLGMISVIFIYIYKDEILTLTGGSFFYRKGFVDNFLAHNGNGKSGGLYKVQQLNIFFRVPLSMLIFFISPIFSISNIYINNIFVVRWFLYYILYPIINIFCVYFFIKALYNLKKNENLRILFYIFLFLLYFVSQFSFQERHTTLYMPLYYIICSYGFIKQKRGNIINFFVIFLILFITIIKM